MHLSLSAVFFFLIFMPVAASATQIVEFCPNPYLPEDPDEFIVIEGSGSLDGITITDGEGGFRFPPGTTINGRLTVAYNSIAFEKTHGRYPDWEWYNYSSSVPDVIRGGVLKLSNSDDTLELLMGNITLQKVSWPGNVTPREGQIHYLEEGVWDRRPLFIGQSTFEGAVFAGVDGEAFVSPDCSLEVFLSVVDNAREDLLVNVYEFTSPEMAASLCRAHSRGVNVTVLLEAGPVGGLSSEEQEVSQNLGTCGISVFWMGTNGFSHAPYRFDHAKYLVADRRSVLVTSENFKPSGFPIPGTSSNRGWGVHLKDEGVAEYFQEVFFSDLNGPGITQSTNPAKGGSTDDPAVSYTKEFSPISFSDASVTPVISPDTSHLIIQLLSNAHTSIEIEQAYISNWTNECENPYLGAALNASRRGVQVRVLLDSTWFNVEDEDDNDEMVARINKIAKREGLPLEARCGASGSDGVVKIHNKGVIVDEREVLVSSINWNENSPGFNREVGVIIGDEEAANYFLSVFEKDWNDADPGPGSRTKTDYLKIAGLVIVVIIIGVLYIRKHLRR